MASTYSIRATVALLCMLWGACAAPAGVGHDGAALAGSQDSGAQLQLRTLDFSTRGPLITEICSADPNDPQAPASCTITDEFGIASVSHLDGMERTARAMAAGHVTTVFPVGAIDVGTYVVDRPLLIHTPADLDAIYAQAGIERDVDAGTLVVQAHLDPRGVRFELSGSDAPETYYMGSDLLLDPQLDAATSAGLAYFLNVVPGARTLVSIPSEAGGCMPLPSLSWPGANIGELRLTVEPGIVTLAGVVMCIRADP